MSSGRPLKVLIAHHRWWFPTAMSGADLANHEFAKKMVERGIDVRVHGISAPGTSHRRRTRRYNAQGISVCLVNSDYIRLLIEEIRSFEPDVVLTTCPEPHCGADDITRMVEACLGLDVPVVLYVHDIETTLPLFARVKDELSAIVTNSRFMARTIRDRWGRECHVVYPVPDSRPLGRAQGAGPFITFFNPSPDKGLGIAHTLVTKRLRDRPFLFVEGFIDPEAHGISLVRSGNLIHARRSPDVATIYAMSRTVIIPSQWEEPFGRIALEAMHLHVPVIASRVGGLHESVGDGGVLIDDYGNVDRWVESIERLDEQVVREEQLILGRHHADSFSLDREIDELVRVLVRASGDE
jgi:hypothetical protein